MKTDFLGRPTAGQKALWEMEVARFRLEYLRFHTARCVEMLKWRSPWEGLVTWEPREELGR